MRRPYVPIPCTSHLCADWIVDVHSCSGGADNTILKYDMSRAESALSSSSSSSSFIGEYRDHTVSTLPTLFLFVRVKKRSTRRIASELLHAIPTRTRYFSASGMLAPRPPPRQTFYLFIFIFIPEIAKTGSSYCMMVGQAAE